MIGRDVLNGNNPFILAGATIGEHTVSGAGSVVKGFNTPDRMAVGSPARVVKCYSFERRARVRADERPALKEEAH